MNGRFINPLKTITKYSGSDQVCSGNGFCECGECICLSSAHGSYCQDCPVLMAITMEKLNESQFHFGCGIDVPQQM